MFGNIKVKLWFIAESIKDVFRSNETEPEDQDDDDQTLAKIHRWPWEDK